MPESKEYFFHCKPRDPKRIPDIMHRVKELWEKAPQLRLGQLLSNTCNGSEVKLYYLEDEELLERLEAMYKDADKDI